MTQTNPFKPKQIGWAIRSRISTYGTNKVYQTEGIARRYAKTLEVVPVYIEDK